MALWAALLLSFAGEPLSLGEAMAIAERGARDVIRAEADLLLVDVERARAWAAVMPSVSGYFTASEVFYGSPWLESRYPVYKVPGCVASAEQTCAATVEPGGSYDLEFKRFFDARADSVSQPQLQLGLNARQLIYDGGRWWAVLGRVSDLLDVQESALRTVRTNARIAALRRFYDLAKAREAVRVAELEVHLSEAQVRRARALVQGEDGQGTDLASGERDLAADKVNLARRSFSAASAGRGLNLAMGREPETPLAIVLPPHLTTATVALEAVDLPSRDALVGLAIQHRTELRQTRALLRVVEKNRSIRGADDWPTIALVGSYSRVSRRPDRIFDNPFENFIATLGLDLRWTFFSGGTTRAALEEIDLERQKAQALLDDLERSVKAEVMERQEELLLLIDVHRLLVDGARSARSARDLTESSYRQGKATSLELRNSEQLLTQAMLDATVGRFNIEVAWAELERAVGVNLEGAPLFE